MAPKPPVPTDEAKAKWPAGASNGPSRPIFVCPVKGCGAHSSNGSCPRGH